MKKDGIDKYPTVSAKDWREAFRLAGSGVTYKCEDGSIVAFGTETVKFRPKR